ncbi:MAG TPA: anaerobic ribonucleoside-triphosphate reductase [Spirochaetia bacterium]|nr:anaerobic ribonucleoside-triphosphate reductase [Spirochaetia bacterium]
MFQAIKKRDGRQVPFDDTKITDAIFKAARAVGGEDRQTAIELTIQVLKMMKASFNGNLFGVEDVQDIVEKVLIESGHARTAKAYILHRDRRTRIREAKGDLMDAVEEILAETSRENANISNSPSAKMLQIASAASKKYYLSRLIPEEMAQAHQRGDLHIHDLDFYGKTLTCIQIPLNKLLTEGFDTGHGYIRPPKRPTSATALAAIILQSSQNDMHGGQSFAFFDRDMAPFVDGATEHETYQAMEALVYNLNSMHSLKGTERIWVFDKELKRLSTFSMEEFHEQFEPGRYAALSLNYATGRTEVRDITASMKHHNFHRLLQVKLKSGQRVAVTDNHSVMTLSSTGEIVSAPPESLEVALTPSRWSVVETAHVYDLSGYATSGKYHLDTLELNEDLARLFGFYVAEGSVDGSAMSLALFDRRLEEQATSLLTRIHPAFTTRLREDKAGKPRDLVCRVGKGFASFVGSVCGKGARQKRVPSEVFFSPERVIRAFLDGYLSGDGTVGKNRVVATSVSQELRDGIALLLIRLGLPCSVSQSIPCTQFAVAHERYKVAVGGYYATYLELSADKGERLADLYRVTTAQTGYDYEFLRPAIATVYGMSCRSAYHYKIHPLYMEELIADLEARILNDSERSLVEKLASEGFWLEQLAGVVPGIRSTERHHLRRLVQQGKLPDSCKYLPVFLPYTQWLKRFLLPEWLRSGSAGSRVHDQCRSPKLIMRFATAILEKDAAMRDLLTTLRRVFQVFPIKIGSIEELPFEPFVYDISVEGNENFMTSQGVFVHNSRAGAQVPFSSINLGTETDENSRKVTRNLLLAFEAGLGRGENPIFPNIIFRVREGVNLNPGDPNHDLFQLAIRVAAKKLNPTFSFMDSSFNGQYGNEVAYMGCRSRVIANRHGEALTAGRGNLSFTTINLPRLALKARGNRQEFYRHLDALMDLAVRQLYHRYQVQARLKVRDMPFVMGQHLYMGSENLGPEDPIEPVIRHGTLTVGFIGLAEALSGLTGSHHGRSGAAQEIGLEIVAYLRQKIDAACDTYDLNYTLLATPAEGLSGRFTALDHKEFGLVPGVNDRTYYTNSFHVPVSHPISAFDKIRLEGPYHKYCNAGHISYVELSSPPAHNLAAVESIIRHMRSCDMGYAGINYPVDFCPACRHQGVINEESCPVCGHPQIRRVRRITGYLSTTDRFNDGKLAELADRVEHNF